MKGFSGNWRGFGSSARAVEADIKVFGEADEANGEIAGPREFEIWFVRVGGFGGRVAGRASLSLGRFYGSIYFMWAQVKLWCVMPRIGRGVTTAYEVERQA